MENIIKKTLDLKKKIFQVEKEIIQLKEKQQKNNQDLLNILNEIIKFCPHPSTDEDDFYDSCDNEYVYTKIICNLCKKEISGYEKEPEQLERE